MKIHLIVEKHEVVRFCPVNLQHTKAGFRIIRANEKESLWKESKAKFRTKIAA